MNDRAQFFVGWGTLSLINAGLAQSKNRSGLLWWIASVAKRHRLARTHRLLWATWRAFVGTIEQTKAKPEP